MEAAPKKIAKLKRSRSEIMMPARIRSCLVLEKSLGWLSFANSQSYVNEVER